MVETKIVVDGKVITTKEYVELISRAREAIKSYKQTPAYAQEQKDKQEMKAKMDEYVKLAEAFRDKTLKVSPLVFSRICLAVYKKFNDSKKE